MHNRTFSLVALTMLQASACSQDVNFGLIESPTVVDEEEEEFYLDTGAPDDTGLPPEEEYEDQNPVEDEEEEPELEDTGEVDPPDEDDCENTSDKVYVIDKDTDSLYLFNPETLGLNLLGELDCDYWTSPGSMAVARDGYGYVRYSDDYVYAVDLQTLECTQTDYNDNQTNFGSFGMGYATNNSETWRDTLYVANEQRVASIDTDTWELNVVGTLSSQSELTGNADGELWAFLPLETPAELTRINTTNGNTVETIKMTNFPDTSNIDTFAFVTWGGDFWLFVREYGMGTSTDVYQVTTDGQMTKVSSNIGINVVGAGVSTCAPTE